MTKQTPPAGVDIRGQIQHEYQTILSPQAIDFLAGLAPVLARVPSGDRRSQANTPAVIHFLDAHSPHARAADRQPPSDTSARPVPVRGQAESSALPKRNSATWNMFFRNATETADDARNPRWLLRSAHSRKCDFTSCL
ncbi:MAG: hypothetical protein OXE52_18180 [Chloroflexi bacterium]|nr:hypothetical protein [Chloroflexota bacterium]